MKDSAHIPPPDPATPGPGEFPGLGVWILLSVLTMVPELGLIFGLVGILIGLASVGLWVYLMIQGFNLKHVRLPIIGAMAERWAAS